MKWGENEPLDITSSSIFLVINDMTDHPTSQNLRQLCPAESH